MPEFDVNEWNIENWWMPPLYSQISTIFLDSTFKGLKALFGFNGILPTRDYESSAGLLNWAV